MKLTQEQIDKILKIFRILGIIFCFTAVGLYIIVKLVMFYNEDAEWCQMVAFISLYTAEALGTLGVLIALGWLFVKLQIAERDKAQSFDETLSSHLIDVTPEQEKQILRLLKRVAKPSDGSSKINRAEVATFLATLKAMGHLEDAGDYNNLRLWVEKETGLKESDKIHFNEAYKRALDRKGDTRYTSELQEILR
jgi:hypothetical protein